MRQELATLTLQQLPMTYLQAFIAHVQCVHAYSYPIHLAVRCHLVTPRSQRMQVFCIESQSTAWEYWWHETNRGRPLGAGVVRTTRFSTCLVPDTSHSCRELPVPWVSIKNMRSGASYKVWREFHTQEVMKHILQPFARSLQRWWSCRAQIPFNVAQALLLTWELMKCVIQVAAYVLRSN